VIALANADGLITMSAGASDVCTREGDLSWDVAIKFDGGDYVSAIFPLVQDGTVSEGDSYTFRVEPGSVAGADICNPTGDQAAELAAEVEKVASGAYAAELGEIAGIAYG
jgi:hypothetical protein